MMYFGLDMGDGESCVHWTKDGSTGMVNVTPISGRGSFLSATARLDGKIIVGHAVKENEESAEDVHVCFKRHFLENDPVWNRVIQDFVRGILDVPRDAREHDLDIHNHTLCGRTR